MAFQYSQAQAAGRINFDRSTPVKLACQGCRAGHQKCDGCLPVCSRCKKEQKACDYTPSRRGRVVSHLHKKPVKSFKSYNVNGRANAPHLESLVPFSPTPEDTIALFAREPARGLILTPTNEEQMIFATSEDHVSDGRIALNPFLLSSFYSYFWPAHPFLPPESSILEHLERSGNTKLQIALDFIGSKYSRAVIDTCTILDTAQSFCLYPRDGYSVQTLILVAISHHMSNEKDTAKMALAKAGEIALCIGLDKEDFAIDHGFGDPLIEESWRRTWWELYILSIMFAAINQESVPQLGTVQLEVQLPSEEATYQSKTILPIPQNLRDFDSRFYNDDNILYSSFTYRIAAARILGKIISGGRKDGVLVSTSRMEVELEMENLILHLPKHMQICTDSEGAMNEVVFQAHMIMHAATIYLHRPRSLLVSSAPSYTIACAPNGNASHAEHMHHHTRKTVNAANEICRLTTASPTLLAHTPFFICAVAMQAIVHLGIYSVRAWAYNQKLAEEQIKMSIGALRKLGEVWQIASTVRQDVKNVAKALLDTSQDSELVRDKKAISGGTASLMSPRQLLDGNGIPLSIEAGAQSNDDSWIDEFLAVNAER